MTKPVLQKSVEHFSLIVSEALDCMGYSREMVRNRAIVTAKGYRSCSENISALRLMGVNLTIVGSRGDGVPYGSDMDLVLQYSSIICYEGQYSETDSNSVTVFKADSSRCPPGYMKLMFTPLIRNVHRFATTCATFRRDQYYFSSLKFQNSLRRTFSAMDSYQEHVRVHEKESNGPAITIKIGMKHPFLQYYTSYDIDGVPALTYPATTTLEQWAARHRYFDWPSRHLVDDVLSSEAVLVPVSLKESKESDLEWRICFPKGEHKLVSSMNDAQMKLYVLLKMVKKDIVGTAVTGLTSYMLKNIVCWVCEGMSTWLFTPERLVDRLNNALYFLKQCLVDNFLPCYLIPERDLFIGKLEGHNKVKLSSLLSQLLRSNGSCLLQCSRLYNSMTLVYNHPSVAIKAKFTKDSVEFLFSCIGAKLISNGNNVVHKDAMLLMMYDMLMDPMCFEALLVAFEILGYDMIIDVLSNQQNSSYFPIIRNIMMT